jgi:hypothetical protein
MGEAESDWGADAGGMRPVHVQGLVTLLMLVTLPVAAANPGIRRGHTAPDSTSRPSISGTAVVGRTLQASTGSWAGVNNSYSFQWLRCNSSGAGCAAISGATGSFYLVANADLGDTLRLTVTARNKKGTDTAPSAPTGVVVLSHARPPATGAVSFDGRATHMTRLYSYETTPGDKSTRKQGQSPALWTCLCFLSNDISLVSDRRYGQMYKNTVQTGTNWAKGMPSNDGSGQLSTRRGTDYGRWDWYAIAVRVPSFSNVSDLSFLDIASLGYQTIQGDQVALKLKNNNGVLYYSINQNSGPLTRTSSGSYAGTVHYNQPILPVRYGQDEEFVIGVKWTADNTGGVVVYARNPAQTSSWTRVFSRLNEPTYATGCTSFSCWTVSDLQSSTAPVLDKIGLYFGMYNGVTPTETVYESGLTRSTSLATGESTLP